MASKWLRKFTVERERTAHSLGDQMWVKSYAVSRRPSSVYLIYVCCRLLLVDFRVFSGNIYLQQSCSISSQIFLKISRTLGLKGFLDDNKQWLLDASPASLVYLTFPRSCTDSLRYNLLHWDAMPVKQCLGSPNDILIQHSLDGR